LLRGRTRSPKSSSIGEATLAAITTATIAMATAVAAAAVVVLNKLALVLLPPPPVSLGCCSVRWRCCV
jgi:hypothetical protein